MNPYRLSVWTHIEAQLRALGPIESALDFGCGDGWFASKVLQADLVKQLTPLDVKRREHVHVEPVIYEPGSSLPFADRSFDLVYTVDVLHHCDDPFAQLTDIARVARQYVLIKDHTYRSKAGQVALAVLDELGNRKFGIPSPYRYQRGWEWTAHLEQQGFKQVSLTHPLPCHAGILGALTNSLQYLALYQRA
jgi:SAM-dependent methyltransferase